MPGNRSIVKVVVFIAAFVLFSVKTIHFLEAGASEYISREDRQYNFDFDHVKKGAPALNLKAAILVNYDNGQVVFAKNEDVVRPVASLTKLITAMVVLDNEVDLDMTVTITKEDTYRSSRSRLRAGYQVSVLDLLNAALLSSDNRAARALARATSGNVDEFVKEMNRKVKRLGLEQTEFYEPTGLDEKNVSTAHEIAKILHHAYDYNLIKAITSKKSHYVRVVNRKGKKLQMVNTNVLIYSPYKVLSGKTGYIKASDYCLTTLVKNKAGERLTLVVLGVPGDKLRFREARKLIDWGFKQSL